MSRENSSTTSASANSLSIRLLLVLLASAVLTGGASMVSAEPLPFAPMKVRSYIEDEIVDKGAAVVYDKGVCLKVLEGADKAVCRLAKFPEYALAFCLEEVFEVSGLGCTKCSDFITRQLDSFEKLNEAVPMPETYKNNIPGIACYEEKEKACRGFIQKFVPDVVEDINFYVRFIRDRQNGAVGEIENKVEPAIAVQKWCSVEEFSKKLAKSNTAALLSGVNISSEGKTLQDIERIGKFIFQTGSQQFPVRLILDLQGLLTTEGHFLVNDPDGILDVPFDKLNKPVDGQIAMCWSNFFLALREFLSLGLQAH